MLPFGSSTFEQRSTMSDDRNEERETKLNENTAGWGRPPKLLSLDGGGSVFGQRRRAAESAALDGHLMKALTTAKQAEFGARPTSLEGDRGFRGGGRIGVMPIGGSTEDVADSKAGSRFPPKGVFFSGEVEAKKLTDVSFARKEVVGDVYGNLRGSRGEDYGGSCLEVRPLRAPTSSPLENFAKANGCMGMFGHSSFDEIHSIVSCSVDDVDVVGGVRSRLAGSIVVGSCRKDISGKYADIFKGHASTEEKPPKKPWVVEQRIPFLFDDYEKWDDWHPNKD